MGSFFQPQNTRFVGTHSFWVEPAKPPEDYIYENLSYGRVNRWFRLVGGTGIFMSWLAVHVCAPQ
jgi:hypothetical protein